MKEEHPDVAGATVTAVGGTLNRDRVAFGFYDGTVRFGQIGFDLSATARGIAPPDLVQRDERNFLSGDRIFSPTQTGDCRTVSPVKALGEPELTSEAAIVAPDHRFGGTAERPTRRCITLDAQCNLMTGAETVRTTTAMLLRLDEGTVVTAVLLASSGDRAIIATQADLLYRDDIRDPDSPILVGRRRVFPDDAAVTAVAFPSGEQALVVGGPNGAVDVFIVVQPEGSRTGDGFELVHARMHEPRAAPITHISVAQRAKSMVMTDASGARWFRHSTSDRVLFRFERIVFAETGSQALIFPCNDGVLKIDDRGVFDSWCVDSPHPEIMLGVLFGRVWSEGNAEPRFIWQSTAGTDTFEAEFALVPLVFGTIKATFHAKPFALPISLMGVGILLTGAVAHALGPTFADLAFAAALIAWTNGNLGTGTPFMTFLLWPLWRVVVGIVLQRWAGHLWCAMIRGKDKPAAGRFG